MTDPSLHRTSVREPWLALVLQAVMTAWWLLLLSLPEQREGVCAGLRSAAGQVEIIFCRA